MTLVCPTSSGSEKSSAIVFLHMGVKRVPRISPPQDGEAAKSPKSAAPARVPA